LLRKQFTYETAQQPDGSCARYHTETRMFVFFVIPNC